MSANAVAKSFGIPRSTLVNRLRGEVEHGTRPVKAPNEVEDEVVEMVLKSAICGFGNGKEELLHRVGILCEKQQLKTTIH